MKNKITLTILILAFSFSAYAQIKVLPAGDLAIGQNYITNNDYKVEINGEQKAALALTTRHETPWAWAAVSDAISLSTKHWIVSLNGYYTSHNFWVYSWGEANAVSYRTWSDASFKQNIRPIENAQSTISLLQPHLYDYIPGFNGSLSYDSAVYTDQPGFIAQELQLVLPHLVNPIDSNGKLGINYQGLIPVVIQCLKDQNARIEELEYNLSMCCANPINSEYRGQKNDFEDENGILQKQLESDKPILENSPLEIKIIPNPTKGKFDVIIENLQSPNDENNILVTTLAGEKVDVVQIDRKSSSKASIDMSGNRDGIYYVHIISNSQVISSKKVVVIN
jgi:hypothetical protein